MNSQSPPPARTRLWQTAAGYLLPGLLVGAVGIGSHFAQRTLGAPPWTEPAAVALVLLLCAKPIVRWWKSFDEVAKEAHRESWFWGGSVGLMVSVIILLTVKAYDRALGLAAMDPLTVFTAGAMCVFLPMALGYGLWWAAWWLKRR